MTTKDRIHEVRAPFIVRFAELLGDEPLHAFRYDPQRQVSQVLVEGRWLDSPEAHLKTHPQGTRLTRVGGETTDDQ